MIVLSEIGDKTFFIAALLAVRHARAVVEELSPPKPKKGFSVATLS